MNLKQELLTICLIFFMVFCLASAEAFSFATENTALIKIKGVITTDETALPVYSITTSDKVTKEIEEAINDASIKAIIIEINSPGGSAVASSEIVEAIKKARENNKFVVALIREQATSGAYWVASACDYVVAHPLSITGSIGVLASYLEFSDFIARYNITYERLVKGEHKDVMSRFRKLTEEERKAIEEKLEIIYNYFIDDVARNRNLSKSKVKELADGMFLTGIEAKKFGLIDALGTKKDVIAYLENKMNTKVRIKEFAKEENLFERLLRYRLLSFFWLGKGLASAFIDAKLMNPELFVPRLI